MKGNSLKKAERLFKARKFSEVIHLLEPQVFRFRENFHFFYFLGVSCLNTGDFGGGFSYLKRAHQLEPENIQAMSGLAVVHLKRQENQEALQLWLQVTDLDPGNRIARKGLSFLRRQKGSEDLTAFSESGKLKNLFPSPGAYVPTWIYAGLLILAVTGAGFFSVPALIRMVDDNGNKDREGINTADMVLPDDGSLQDLEGQHKYILTDKEIRDTLKRALEYFYEYRDNLTQREVNRIMLSNAAVQVKEKAKVLATVLKEPGFTSLKDTFTYSEIRKDPALYEKCFTRWKGRVTNVKIQPDTITFDFLVGYDSGKVLEGTVPAFISFPVDISTELPIEVLGQIQVKDNIISLRVTSIHQLSQ